jgi:SH3-like domain-containing protein
MRVLLLLAFLLLPAAAAPAAGAKTVGTETGLPIPRFVTLKSDEVNVRTGPGVRYPVDWVFLRRSMPVEIVAEFDTWRKIRDFEGTEGWVHQFMLSGRRTVLVIGQVRTIRRDPNEASPAVARVEPGVVAELEACRPAWCEIQVSGISGWVQRSHVWGVRLDEGQ